MDSKSLLIRIHQLSVNRHLFMKLHNFLIFPFFMVLLFPFIFGMTDQTKPSVNQELPTYDDYCRTNNNTFSNAEILTYKLYYNVNFLWIGAGTVTFKIEDRGDHFFAEAIGRTHGGYDWIFKVRDTVQSIINKETLLPEETVRIVNEGSYTRYDHVKYMRNSRLARSEMGKTRNQTTSETINIDQCVHDILSTVYAFRNTPTNHLGEQSIFSLDMLLDRKKYPISMRFHNAEKGKKIKGIGPVDTYMIEPKLIVGNVFSDEDGMKIWVSQDNNKVPLLIESPIAVGKIKAVLDSHSGLKYAPNGY